MRSSNNARASEASIETMICHKFLIDTVADILLFGIFWESSRTTLFLIAYRKMSCCTLIALWPDLVGATIVNCYLVVVGFVIISLSSFLTLLPRKLAVMICKRIHGCVCPRPLRHQVDNSICCHLPPLLIFKSALQVLISWESTRTSSSFKVSTILSALFHDNFLCQCTNRSAGKRHVWSITQNKLSCIMSNSRIIICLFGATTDVFETKQFNRD